MDVVFMIHTADANYDIHEKAGIHFHRWYPQLKNWIRSIEDMATQIMGLIKTKTTLTFRTGFKHQRKFG